jgi:amino acid permease
MSQENDETFHKVKCNEEEEIEVEKSSFTTVFTIWNLLAGPSVLALPYAYYNSGLLVGILITFLTYVASLRT